MFNKNILFFLLIIIASIVILKLLKNKKTETKENINTQIFPKDQKTLTLISLLAKPGAGKGTLAQQCVEKLNYKVLSTGNLCRENIAQQTEFGKQLDSYIKQGKLVPDEIICNMVKDWLQKQKNSQNPIILDGFPRTVIQARELIKILKEVIPNHKLRIITLDISDEEIIKRLTGRRVCPNKECQAVYHVSMLNGKDTCEKCGTKLITREDDKEEVIKERFAVYKQNEKALVDFYIAAGLTIEKLDITGKTPEQIFEEFKKIS